jgi:hypothetical protein
MRWFPIPPLLALGYVTYQTARDPEIGRPSLLVTLGILVVATIYYLTRRRNWTLRAPDDEASAAGRGKDLDHELASDA